MDNSKTLRQHTKAKKNKRTTFSHLPKSAKIGLLVALIVSILAVFGIGLPIIMDNDETQYLSETSLKNAVNIENLAAIDYTYKGIAEKEDQFLWIDKVDYRVKYEAHVRANYNMSAIEFSLDEKNKVATAYLPEPEISSPVLDETKFGYLPEKTTADMKDILALCKEDAARELNTDEMRTEASESLQNIITALTMPLLGNEWNLEFKNLSEYPTGSNKEVYDEVQ